MTTKPAAQRGGQAFVDRVAFRAVFAYAKAEWGGEGAETYGKPGEFTSEDGLRYRLRHEADNRFLLTCLTDGCLIDLAYVNGEVVEGGPDGGYGHRADALFDTTEGE